MTTARPIRWRRAVTVGLILSLPMLAAIGWTASRDQPDEPSPPDQGPPRTLQEVVERGYSGLNDFPPERIKALMPFDSISLERTPCFGTCPVYTVNFHKDGRATLLEQDWSRGLRLSYTGEISPLEFARLCQLVELARRVADKPQYAGSWTDDSAAIVRVRSRTQSWEVVDYGRVAPVEVWALEKILHSLKEDREWSLVASMPLSDGPGPGASRE